MMEFNLRTFYGISIICWMGISAVTTYMFIIAIPLMEPLLIAKQAFYVVFYWAMVALFIWLFKQTPKTMSKKEQEAMIQVLENFSKKDDVKNPIRDKRRGNNTTGQRSKSESKAKN